MPAPDGGVIEVPDPNGPAWMLSARRAPDGTLTVVIMTNWGSHASIQAGFAYYELPPAEKTDEEGHVELDLPGDLKEPSSKRTIDAHWREVYNPNAD